MRRYLRAVPAAAFSPMLPAVLTAVVALTLAAACGAATLSAAIITGDAVSLRAAPRDAAQQQAQLWQGELVEVRGERMDYLQVYDHRRERAGYVRASQVRRTTLAAGEAPELLAQLRFVREMPGNEALGIGLAAAYLKAAPVEVLNGEAGTEALDALGTLAERLARRASSGATLGKSAEATLSAHLEVAAQYGVHFTSYEHDGRMQICYDGEAFRRVLARTSGPEPRARAALALTRPECADPALRPAEQAQLDAWRAEVLERVDAVALPGYLKNRVQMRRAGLYSALAYQRARQGQPADAAAMSQAAQRALAELAGVNKDELTDDDLPLYNDAAMRVNASRWAALPQVSTSQVSMPAGNGPTLVTQPGQAGETCVLLVDAKNDARNPLARRCTYSVVWAGSATLNREGTALALAVQPLAGWRELWIFRKLGKDSLQGQGNLPAGAWHISVLPPMATSPELGYAEFAGWVPGGQQMLVAREARDVQGGGKYRRSYELLRLDGLVTERQAGDPAALGAFQRWQDPAWKRQSVSLR